MALSSYFQSLRTQLKTVDIISTFALKVSSRVFGLLELSRTFKNTDQNSCIKYGLYLPDLGDYNNMLNYGLIVTTKFVFALNCTITLCSSVESIASLIG